MIDSASQIAGVNHVRRRGMLTSVPDSLLTTRRRRPWWATSMAAFCAATVLFLIYRDLTIPHVRNTEVWFGFEVTGALAWATAPLHWAFFAIGAWGYWRGAPWIWPGASVYAFYIAVSHLIWNLTSPHGEGWSAGLWQLALFSVPAVALLFARPSAERAARSRQRSSQRPG